MTTQVSLAVILLVAAGLLIRSLGRLLDVQPGFRAEHVFAQRSDAGARHPLGPQLRRFLDEIVERVSVLPGVQSAAVIYNLPLDRNMIWDVAIPGK